MRQPASVAVSVVASVLLLAGGPLPTGRPLIGPDVSLAQDGGWKAEYDSVCSKTDIAMTLAVEELKGLIARCDNLKPRIEAEDESTRKVFLRRLQMCQDLYAYVLASKESR